MEFWQRHCGSGEFGNFKLEPESSPIGLSHLTAIMLSVFIVLSAGGITVSLLELACDKFIQYVKFRQNIRKRKSLSCGKKRLKWMNEVDRFLNQAVDPALELIDKRNENALNDATGNFRGFTYRQSEHPDEQDTRTVHGFHDVME